MEFNRLGLEALEALLIYHKKMMLDLGCAIREEKARLLRNKKMNEEISEIARAKNIVLNLVKSGIDPRVAIIKTAGEFGWRSESIELYLRNELRSDSRFQKKYRDARVADLRAAGLSTGKIAKIVNCHRNTVSRTDTKPFYEPKKIRRPKSKKPETTILNWPHRLRPPAQS